MSGNGSRKRQMETVAKPERVKKIQNVTSQSKGIKMSAVGGARRKGTKNA